MLNARAGKYLFAVNAHIKDIDKHPVRYGFEKTGDRPEEIIKKFHHAREKIEQFVAVCPENCLGQKFPEDDDEERGQQGFQDQEGRIYVRAGYLRFNDNPFPERIKGLSDHETKNDQKNIKSDQRGANELRRILDKPGYDQPAAATLFLF